MFHRSLDLFFSFCLTLLISWFLWEARDWSFYSRLFPWFIGFIVLLLALIQVGLLLRGLRVRRVDVDIEAEGHIQYPPLPLEQENLDHGSEAFRIVTIGCWIFIFFIGIWLLGFRLGSLILTIGFLKLAAKESYKNCIRLGAVNYFFFLIVFDLALGVPLFEGVIAQWAGIVSVDGFLIKQLGQIWS